MAVFSRCYSRTSRRPLLIRPLRVITVAVVSVQTGRHIAARRPDTEDYTARRRLAVNRMPEAAAREL